MRFSAATVPNWQTATLLDPAHGPELSLAPTTQKDGQAPPIGSKLTAVEVQQGPQQCIVSLTTLLVDFNLLQRPAACSGYLRCALGRVRADVCC